MNLAVNDLFNIQGKVAVVTGGSRGIGEMIAAGFLANGAKVYISSRKAEVCDATAARLSEEYGGQCISIPGDLSRVEGCQALADEIAAREDKIDILVNNAGASWGEPLEEFPEMGWDKVMDTNVKGVFFLTQKLIPLLKASGTAADPARVISIGSIDGLVVSSFETPSYGASKAAVHHLSRFMAKHLTGSHINFNNIAPGPYPTWMLSTGVGFGGKTEGEGVDWDLVGRSNPSGRVGTPEDIAGLAIFLCSRAGAYIVGQTIASDGGTVAVK
jgi:NAD(P)-dependent dehydrogenase (short-subunit alcohol dehydrogenase family)